MSEADNNPPTGLMIPVGPHHRVRSDRNNWVIEKVTAGGTAVRGYFGALEALKKVTIRDFGDDFAAGDFDDLMMLDALIGNLTRQMTDALNSITGLKGIPLHDKSEEPLYLMLHRTLGDRFEYRLHGKRAIKVDKYQFKAGEFRGLDKKGRQRWDYQHVHFTIEATLAADFLYYVRTIRGDWPGAIEAIKQAGQMYLHTIPQLENLMTEAMAAKCKRNSAPGGRETALKTEQSQNSGDGSGQSLVAS